MIITHCCYFRGSMRRDSDAALYDYAHMFRFAFSFAAAAIDVTLA